VILGNERGSVAVVTAVSLFALVGVMAFTLDTGYLYLQKNRIQNAVEAAALAGVSYLCEGDADAIEAVVRSVAEANGLSPEAGPLSVSFGFYDERNQHGDFPVYRDFVDEDAMPPGQHINAVLVTYVDDHAALTGLNAESRIAAAAAAYLRRLDMVSLEGEIRLGHDSEWENCTFFSNETIKYPAAVTMAGRTYSPPDFLDSLLLTVSGLVKCPVSITSSWFGSRMSIHWDSGSLQSPGNSRTNLEPMKEIRPVDEGTLEYWRQRADTVYTPDQAGDDDIFYGVYDNYYYVDLGGVQSSERRVIFFDAGEDSSRRVLIGPVPRNTDPLPHVPNGFSTSNVTFVATCSILIQHNNTNRYPLATMGTDGMKQVVVISAKDIELNTGGIIPDGVVFRTGGDFLLRGVRPVKMRVIADGEIDGDIGGVTTRSNRGMICESCDCVFGPPCPPVLPRLGALEHPSR